WMPYEEITAVTRNERSVTINRQVTVCFRTVSGAAGLVARLDAMRQDVGQERSHKIRREMKRAFNLPEARRVFRRTGAVLDALRWSANLWLGGILAAYLFAAAQFGYATMTLFLLLALEAAAIH